MADPSVAVGFMAFVFGIHIILVNIDMGLAILVPILKRVGEVRNNNDYIREAKRYMQYFAIIYASAGVFGTAFTVFLLSFFPSFLWLGGILLLIPFGLAAVFVTLRLLSIAAYWYTWDRLRSDYHFYLGLTLAATSFLVPLMFRTVFAFLNNPIGVQSITPLVIDWGLMFLNPTLWPLYLKSITGAIAATVFMLVSLYAYQLYRGKGNEELNRELIKKYLNVGMWLLALMLLFGFWYLASLGLVTPYKFSNVAGAWFGIAPQGIDLSWLFALKLALVGYQIFVFLYLLRFVFVSGSVNYSDKTTQLLLICLGPAAILTILLGEYLNAFSQLPYFVAVPSLETALPEINLFNSINPLATLFDVYVLAVFAGIPLLTVFFVMLYYILRGRISSLEG